MDIVCPIGDSYNTLIKFVKDRPGHDYRYAIDSSKILNDLNWSPKFNFEKGIIKTINWYLENTDWFNEGNKKEINIITKRQGIIDDQ